MQRRRPTTTSGKPRAVRRPQEIADAKALFGSRDNHPGRVRIAEGQIAQLAAQNGRDSTKRRERSSTTANRRERNHLPHN